MDIREPIVLYGKSKFTEEEYLEFEKNSLEKHEYYRGEIFPLAGRRDFQAMSGAGARHNIIFSNFFGSVSFQLKGKPCQPYGSDLRINIPENTLYTYPDVSIICGDLIEEGVDKETASRPTVIVEILSPSTRNYDRKEKFELYRAIPTLKEYILIDADSVHIESYRLNESGRWELEDYKDLSATLLLPVVQVSVPLADIYEGTKLV